MKHTPDPGAPQPPDSASGSASPQPGPGSGKSPWSQKSKDLWFFCILALSAISLVLLFAPFFYVILFAVVVVVVSWQLYQKLLKLCRGRRTQAAILSAVILALVVFIPFALILYLFILEAIAMAQTGVAYVRSGVFEERMASMLDMQERLDALPEWVRQFLPQEFNLADTIARPLGDLFLGGLNAIGSNLPHLLNATFNVLVVVVIFVFAVISLYMQGPRILQIIKNLSPIDDTYEDNLFKAFAEMCRSLVIGSLATGVVQGMVAAVGYSIVGLDRVVFFATMTGIFSFFPVVGTTLIWVPLSLMVAGQQGWGWGLFLGIYSLVLTAQADQFLRPFLMRGSSNIHPLLIFLAFFGGMSWMGLPGILVGPVLVAFFLALYRIYERDYLGIVPVQPDEEEEKPCSLLWQTWPKKILATAQRLVAKARS